MKSLFFKEYNNIEGRDFWKKYGLIGDLPLLKQTTWDSYPEISDPKDQIKDGKVIELKDKRKIIVRISPKVSVYISNNYNVPTIESFIKKYVNFEMNQKMFFTLKGYAEFIKEKVTGFNKYNYSRFTFQPQRGEIEFFRLFPTFIIADQSKEILGKPLGHASILSSHTDSLKIRNPPIRISTFNDMPEYKKKRIVKNWVGLSSLEPTKDYSRKIAAPLFLNPSFVLIEFSPYIADENSHLDKVKEFFKFHSKDWNFHRNNMIDVSFYINYLKTQPERKRSKLDFLVDYIRKFQKAIMHPRLIRKIYDYKVVTREEKGNNGLYVARRNGELTNMIYFLKFDSIEFFRLEKTGTREGYIDLVELFNPLSITDVHFKNLYHFTSLKDKNFKVKKRYILFKRTPTNNYYTFENVDEVFDRKRFKKLNKVDITQVENYKVMKKIYFIRKRYYHSDKILMDIQYPVRSVIGSVRAKGEKIIYIIKY